MWKSHVELSTSIITSIGCSRYTQEDEDAEIHGADRSC